MGQGKLIYRGIVINDGTIYKGLAFRGIFLTKFIVGNYSIGNPNINNPELTATPTVTNIQQNQFTVNWQVNKLVTGQVEYGITNSLGSATILDAVRKTSFTQTIDELNTATNYFFRVSGTDIDGNIYVSATQQINTSGVVSSGNANYFSLPTGTAPNIVATYTPTSAADLSNAANANRIAIISNSFSATGVTLAAGQIIRPAGGVISGTNINLNGAFIEEVAQQAFSANATFTSVYNRGYIFLETLGAVANNAVDDSASITTALRFFQFTKGIVNGVYLKNSPEFVNRVGEFTLDLQGGRIEITNNSNYSLINDQQSAIWTGNLSLKFINGTFDGNDNFGRAFSLISPEAYHFENFTIENLYAVSTAQDGRRSVAVQIDLWNESGHTFVSGQPFGTSKAATSLFRNGYCVNSTFRDIDILGDCQFNTAIGVSKGWWILYHEIDPLLSGQIYHANNVYLNIEGEDAEGVYLSDETWASGNKVITHLITATFYRERFENNSRRAIKAVTSNVTIDECVFIMPTAAQATATIASLVSIFTLMNVGNPAPNANDYSENIIIRNSTFTQPEILPEFDLVSGCNNGNSFIPDVNLLDLQNVRNFLVEGNTFTRPRVDNYNTIVLGSSGSVGKMGVGTLRNNIHTNAGYAISDSYDGQGLVTIENETINFTNFSGGNGGGTLGAFRLVSLTDNWDNFIVRNSTINIDWTSIAPITGLFISKGGSMANGEFNNVTVNYLNGSAGGQPNWGLIEAVGGSAGNLPNTISFINCILTGSSGTGAIQRLGTGTPTIINSFGVVNGVSTAITVQ